MSDPGVDPNHESDEERHDPQSRWLNHAGPILGGLAGVITAVAAIISAVRGG